MCWVCNGPMQDFEWGVDVPQYTNAFDSFAVRYAAEREERLLHSIRDSHIVRAQQ